MKAVGPIPFAVGVAAGLLLAGCSVLPVSLSKGQDDTQAPSRVARAVPEPDAKQVLVVGEEGRHGLIEIYSAPFNGAPQRLYGHAPIGLVIAPNGTLLVATAQSGLFAYDPPFTRARTIWNDPDPTGQLLFDSKGRLLVPYGDGLVSVWKPPYRGKPALTFSIGADLDETAIDGKDDVFAGSTGTLSGRPTYECKPPSYTYCKKLAIGNGTVALDRAASLFTGVSTHTVGEFDLPYDKRPVAKATLPFYVDVLTAAADGDLLVAGGNSQGMYYTGVFLGSLKGRFKEVPMADYFRPNLNYWVAKNRDLFVSDGTYQKPCVGIYPYPYAGKPVRCIRTTYPIQALFAR